MIEENPQDSLSETPDRDENVVLGVDGASSDASSSIENLEAEENDAETNAVPLENEDGEESEKKSATLEEALEKYEIQLPAKQVRLLKEYCELLWTWNERINLTRHDDFDNFVSRDLVDSMRLAQCFQKGEHVLDVGSGGGVPGLVLAILRPDVVVELCEATGKKAEALGAMVDGLGLDLNVWYAKAEDLLKVHHFHSLTIRAVGKINKLLAMFAPLWHSFDRILMIKGPKWADERGEARHYNALLNIALRKVDEYENPGAEHGSVILQFCRKSRFEEIERRAQDRAEGKPIDRKIEPVEVDNSPRDIAERGFSRGGRNGRIGRGGRDGDGERRNAADRKNDGERKGRFSRDDARPRRAFVAPQNRREDDNSSNGGIERKPFANGRDSENAENGGERNVRVFARKNGKPPKGWTGNNREFRAESNTENGDERSRREKRFGGDRSSSGKSRFAGGKSSSGGARFGGSGRSGGKYSGKRSQGRPGKGPDRGGRGGNSRGAE